MKRLKTQSMLSRAIILLGVFSVIMLSSCKKDDPIIEDPIASFQYEISEQNFLQVAFTNFSQNAETYSWNFGDGQTSTEVNPTHTYAAVGEYTVVLTATNKASVNHTFSETILITDPFEAFKLLTGEVSKTWKLYREGISMSLGPDASNPAGWWPGLENNGQRPCMYYQEFTFHFDGKYVFDDKGSFWGEYGVWGNVPGYPNSPLNETCFEATPANMVNARGEDVSKWLSGIHSFTYDVPAGTVTLNGLGAWIGIPKLGTNGETLVPVPSVSFKVSITQETGFDLMTIVFDWGTAGYWKIVYVSYSDPSLEPPVEEDEQEWGEDLPDITPDELSHTFESATSFVLLGEIGGASVITPGVDDPADAAATKVGGFDRTDAQYQEAMLFVSPDRKDIQFDNLTTISIEVYLPSSNTYDPLTKKVIIGFGDVSATQQWWNRLIQYESDELALDQWVTVTFNLDTPSYSSVTDETPYDRDDLDMVYIQIGGGDHTSTGVFYIRNLIIE